jgi:hypothetical protein
MSLNKNGQPTSYTVQINEYQRNLIMKLMLQTMNNVHYAQHMLRTKGEFHETMHEEVNSLIGLLHELPEHEKKDPGITHGLCL